MDMKHVIQSIDLPTAVPKIELALTVNGVLHQLKAAPAARLLDILREDLGLSGTKCPVKLAAVVPVPFI